MGTCFSITLSRVSVKALSDVLNSGMLRKVCGIGSLVSSSFAVLEKACQSTSRQLRRGVGTLDLVVNLMEVCL